MTPRKLSIVRHPDPELLIVEGGDCLHDLQQCLRRNPEFDIDVVMDHLIDCIFEYRTVENELLHLKSTLLRVGAYDPGPVRHDRGMLYEAFDDEVFTLEDLHWKAVRVGLELKTLFKRLKLFEEDILRYQHSRIIGDRTIILRRRRR